MVGLGLSSLWALFQGGCEHDKREVLTAQIPLTIPPSMQEQGSLSREYLPRQYLRHERPIFGRRSSSERSGDNRISNTNSPTNSTNANSSGDGSKFGSGSSDSSGHGSGGSSSGNGSNPSSTSTAAGSSGTGASNTDANCNEGSNAVCSIQECEPVSNVNANATYSSGWSVDVSQEQCTFHSTNANGSSMNFTFVGSGVTAMGFIRPSNDSNFIPAAYAIDGGTPMNPSFPSANGTFKQSLFTATSLDPNTTHTLSITIVNGSDSAPYSLTNFLIYNPPTGTINKDNQDDRQGHGNSNLKSSPAPNTSTIVAAVLAAVFFVLLASILFVLWWRRRQRIRRARNRAPSMHTMSTLTGTDSILQATRYPFGGFGTSTIAATSVLGSPGRSPPTGPTLVPFIFTPPGSRRNSRAVTDPVTRTGRRSLLSGVTPSQHAESEPVRPSRSDF